MEYNKEKETEYLLCFAHGRSRSSSVREVWCWECRMRQDWTEQGCQNGINHLWREGLGDPHIPFLAIQGGIWGSELKGTGKRGAKRDTCKLEAGSVSPEVRCSWGKEGTWPTWDPAVVITTRWQAWCPAWGQEAVCSPPTARSPFRFSPSTDKVHFSTIFSVGDRAQARHCQIRELWDGHSHTPVDGGEVWVSLLQSGLKSHRTVAAFRSLSLSLLSSKGSQRVSAGRLGWADFPKAGRGQDLTRFVLHVF